MFYIDWDDSLSVGVQQFDDHHKYLVCLLNKTYNACTCDNMEEVLTSILAELVEYSKYHFAAEENLMMSHDYSEFEFHKIEHRAFCEKIMQINQDFHEIKRNPSITLIDVAMLLGNWLSQHILKADKRFGMCIAASKTFRAATEAGPASS
jgi:hemerythrin-like metal-binding protein